MLAEDFVGNMENGGEFGGGRLEWDMKSNSWEWENVMMYPGRLDVGRKPHGSDWGEEPVVVSGSISSGIPGIAATSSSSGLASVCGSLQRVYPERNSSDSKALGGLPSQVKPEADDHGGKEQNAPCLDLATRSGNDKADKKVNGVMSGVEKQSSVANLSASQQKKHFLGLGGGAHEKEDLAKEGGKQAANGNHDAEIGLKLGKRTYFEDTSVATASKTPAASPPGKKSRGSAANHAPRCQVEGCKTDLSSAKDYHRRHKVCAMHSKSAKVCVNTIEQRFCQQCSRFHVLSEFDEGKRSCRRRLAGHNERRRKPQPDPMALASAAVTQADLMRRAIGLSRGDDRLLGYGLGPSLSFLGLDDVHNKFNYSKGGNWPRFGNLDDHTGLVPGLSNLPRSAERLLMFLPHRKGPLLNGIGGHSVHQFMQGSGSMGQNLSLSSSAGTGLYTGLGSSQASQGVTGVSDSGRALSLLSSQSWAASTQDSMPLDMSQKSNLALEQLISENRAPYSQQTYSGSSPVRQQHYAPSAEKLLSHPGQGSISGGQSQGGAFLPSMGVNNYENHSVLTLLQESELRGLQNQHARPTIDLMQMSNHQQQQHAHSPVQAVAMQQQQQPSSGHLSDFQVLKPYGSTMYDPQEL